MILKTTVLPIEYDEKTKNKAQRLKRFLEQNPTFFKTFLKGDKISYTDKNSPLYLGKHQSILDFIKEVNPIDCLQFIYGNPIPNDAERIATLFILTNEKVEGEYAFTEDDIENAHLGALYAYCFDTEDYEKLKDNGLDKNTISSWFYEKYRFSLFNYILELSIEYIKKHFEYDSTLENFIQEMIKTTVVEVQEFTNNTSYQEITYPINKEVSFALVEEFLNNINPSWADIFKTLVKENRIIDDYQDEKIVGLVIQGDCWQCMYGNDNTWYIYAQRKNTIEDTIDLLHEVIHYIIESQNNGNPSSSLKEFPSLFFEQVFCSYLIQKGYPKEEINKYRENRRCCIEENCMGIIDFLIYLNLKIEKEKITEEEMLLMETEGQEESKDKIESKLKKAIDEYIEEDFHQPQIYMKMYMYIEGKRYADIMFERLQKDSRIMDDMIEITNNQKNLPGPHVLAYLNLSPPTKEEALQKVYQ